MQYGEFVETLELFPAGRYLVNSLQLLDLLSHKGCTGVEVRVLHIGTIALDQDELRSRLHQPDLPRLDDVKITCLDGTIIIDEPSWGN